MNSSKNIGSILIAILFLALINTVPINVNGLKPSNSPIIKDTHLKVEIVYRGGLSFPTSMAFLGQNDILVLEKDNGTVRRIVHGKMLPKPLLDVNVATKEERGMIGIAIGKKDHNIEHRSVFLYYTESATGKDSYAKQPLGNRLYKYAFQDNKLLHPKLLLDVTANSTLRTGDHNGGKILLGPDKKIYLVVGDMDRHITQAQNIPPKLPDGTSVIYRITQDGKAVKGKGILGNKYPLNLYYAYGIRNSFGMDFDPVTGNLWDTENGPLYGDEINLVKPGFNSGWIPIQGFSFLDNTFHPHDDLVDFNGKGKYRDPEFEWKQTVGPTAIKFLNSDKYGKKYQNDIFVGDVKYGNLYHFDLNKNRTQLILKGLLADKIANNTGELQDVIFGQGFGGINDIEIGPDGYLYILSIKQFRPLHSPLDKDQREGTIYRIVPTSEHKN